MPINASPHYNKAESEYLSAQTTEQKIRSLKKMMTLSPKHKGAENLNARLKRRLAKLKYTNEKEIKKKKGSIKGIKKEEMQTVIIGMTNTGKSSLLSILTNACPKIASYKFTTQNPRIGIMKYAGVNIQIIEIPAFESEHYDKGLANSADTILILITDLNQIEEIEENIKNARGKKIIVFNTPNFNNEEIRKISATLASKRYNFVVMSTKTKQNIELLKDKIFKSFNKIRIYTKEPGKEINREKDRPVILEKDSCVNDIAEKILHGFSNQIRETKIWGPSSKFSGQVVGLKHRLKDLDTVEFKTK